MSGGLVGGDGDWSEDWSVHPWWRRYGLVGGGDVGFVGPQAATSGDRVGGEYRDRLSD
jgi:hypothetical protein